MLRTEFQSQHFTTEEEEATWWDQHQDALAEEFECAAASGSLGHATVAHKYSEWPPPGR